MQADEYCNELEVTIFDSITEVTVLSQQYEGNENQGRND